LAPALSNGASNLYATRAPHAAEREAVILAMLRERGFVAFRDLERDIGASPATLRRDLERLAAIGRITRVHGGARIVESAQGHAPLPGLQGVPFHENIGRNTAAKQAIGRAAAALCSPGESVMIDGGSTTLQMCPHLDGMNLQVLTNSLHIVSALLPQAGTRVLVPGGAVFREQNIILSAGGENLMPRCFAPKLFLGAGAVHAQGVMQPDVVLVAAERRLIANAEQVILLVDSTKFQGASGNILCPLDTIDIVVTDAGIGDVHRRMLAGASVRLVIS
jgi:DeoR family ulaG and ulaABCDEF operon transcriptional repressor